MREYQPIWNQLKKDRVVSITANRLLHPRIIKAVTKEKWMDVGYKVQCDPSYAKLHVSANNSILTFSLTFHQASPITLKDL
jgi:hypothetical protein